MATPKNTHRIEQANFIQRLEHDNMHMRHLMIICRDSSHTIIYINRTFSTKAGKEGVVARASALQLVASLAVARGPKRPLKPNLTNGRMS